MPWTEQTAPADAPSLTITLSYAALKYPDDVRFSLRKKDAIAWTSANHLNLIRA